MSSKSRSPPWKRVKLESPAPVAQLDADDQDLEFQCSICLQEIVDRTVIPTCFHEFCFECLVLWSDQSRRCPLCSQPVGEYLLHNIRSKYDFRKHYLAPLRKSPAAEQHSGLSSEARRRQRNARERARERRLQEERDATDKLARSIEKRRWIYQYDLYAKHVASNSYTRYRPYPTPAQFAASNDLISRTTTFLRRELQVWDHLDVEFLTTFTISMMKAIDIRSESAVKLLAEFLDIDAPYTEGGRHTNAEHFAHEVYSYVRSPFRDLFVYDTAIQYDFVNEAPPPEQRGRRWHSINRSRSHSRSRSPPEGRSATRDRSISWSPSGSSRDAQRSRAAHRSRERRLDRNDSDSDRRRISQNDTTSHGPGTSRRPGPSVKGKGRADPSCATPVDVDESGPIALPVSEAGSSSVAQSSNQVESPAPPSWPSRARPLRFGHRSLLQSVQTHLKQGVDNQMSGFKGKPERHHDSSMTHDSTSSTPPALLARLSDVTPTSGAQLADRGSELGASTRSQSTAIRHRDLPPKGTTLPSPSREVHSAEIMPQSRTKVALEPRSIPETKSDKLPSPSPSSSIHDRQTPQASRPSQIHGMPENIRILGAAKGQANLTTSTLSPPTPSLSILDRATTTTTTATTSLPISSSSEKLSQHDVAPGIQHMGISLHDSSFDHHEPRPLISAHANDDQSHQSSRKELLARLEREKLQACAEELGSDRTSRMSDVDRHAMSTFEPEQVPGSTVVDPHVIEAKLRTRAQLQVRLAAERSSLVSHVVSLLH